MSAHIMGASRVNHGLSQCTKCLATDREIAFALGLVCPVPDQPAVNMVTHTAAPWLVNPSSAWIEVPDVDAPICALLWPTDLRSEDETFANARLIAASPALLEALEQTTDMLADLYPGFISGIGPYNEQIAECDALITAARAAISSARGAGK